MSAAIIVPMRFVTAAASVLVAVMMGGCLPLGALGTLAPTLTMSDQGGLAVAVQNGMPVPTFEWQPRPRIDLAGEWLVKRAPLDEMLTMTARDASLAAIEEEAAGRQLPDHDDSAWETLAVPGTLNEPPDGEEGGALYRRAFQVPRSWGGEAVTIRFGSANYVADVWLNGTWLGYHEGGSTPFAFEAGAALRPGAENVLAVRVHTIPLGTRSDVIPWAAVDWWNYGGLTGPVWLEAAEPTHIVRADVVPHLDAVDVEVMVHRSARLSGPPDEGELEAGEDARVRLSIFPATVDDANLFDPDPRQLVPDPAGPLAVVTEELELPAEGEVRTVSTSILFGDADAWSPAIPALYVLHAEILPEVGATDGADRDEPNELWTTFGIRHVAIDPVRPRVLLNGEAVFFRGVGLHAETLTFDGEGDLVGGTPAQSSEHVLDKLEDARAVGADLLRTGHLPADPTTLMLADRLGFAVWEEIPLYHATPAIFERTMGRGIPQQMLREMALRDMNRPSVLFHGFANESTGGEERTAALAELHEIDRAVDGTRLTGQAAYGWQPADPTHEPLDVAGFTFYHGVFYGSEAGPDTRRALREVHEANPTKPIMVLEFGRWADFPADEEQQLVIFEETYAALEQYRADEPGGFVSGATWWTLRDFATQLGGIGLEDFGLFRPDGTLRPAGVAASASLAAPAGGGSDLMLDPDMENARARPDPTIGDLTLLAYLAYGLGLSTAAIGAGLFVLTRRGGRATGRGR